MILLSWMSDIERAAFTCPLEVGDGHNLPSDQPRKLRDIDDPDGDDGVDQLGTEDGRNRQGQDEGWKRNRPASMNRMNTLSSSILSNTL